MSVYMPIHARPPRGVPPELLTVECPREAGAREAAAALLEAASYARRAAGAALATGALSVFMAVFAASMFLGVAGLAPGFFLAAAATIVLFTVLLSAYSLYVWRRRRRLALLLERAAGMVQAGLLPPEKVCGAYAGVVARLVEGVAWRPAPG